MPPLIALPQSPAQAAEQQAHARTEAAVEQAVQQARNSVYFNWVDSLGGVGSGLTSGLSASNGALGGMTASSNGITMADLQRTLGQMSAITVGTPSNSVYHAGVDAAALASWNGIQVVTVPSLPPGEIRYVPAPTIEWHSRQSFYSVPQEVFQYQTFMNGITSSVLGISGFGMPETPEQRRAREEAHVKEMAKRSAAEKRAEQLMFTILKPEQVRQYQDHGYFETEVDDRVYRIHKRGHSQNVELIVKGRVVAKYCAHPSNCYRTPVQDTMISQLLALHHDEAAFLRTANKTIIHQ